MTVFVCNVFSNKVMVDGMKASPSHHIASQRIATRRIATHRMAAHGMAWHGTATLGNASQRTFVHFGD